MTILFCYTHFILYIFYDMVVINDWLKFFTTLQTNTTNMLLTVDEYIMRLSLLLKLKSIAEIGLSAEKSPREVCV